MHRCDTNKLSILGFRVSPNRELRYAVLRCSKCGATKAIGGSLEWHDTFGFMKNWTNPQSGYIDIVFDKVPHES